MIETRPDWVTPAEVLHLRRLGVTKVQLGVQSLDDRILALNERGHDVEAVRRAVRLLRAAGFKLHLHWMPNLFGATPESDRADFARLWSDPALRPDELKIYPCSIIEGTELYRPVAGGPVPAVHRRRADRPGGRLQDHHPALLPGQPGLPRHPGRRHRGRQQALQPAPAGPRANWRRQDAAASCIRCREVREAAVDGAALRLVVHAYETDGSHEQFLSYETADGQLAGFLRLSLPAAEAQRGRARDRRARP